jgi:polyphosphate kinase 2 (PPK2 family)
MFASRQGQTSCWSATTIPGWLKKAEGTDYLEMSTQLAAEYQERLASQQTYGLLVVLQGIDASGKDGTIRHVMSGVNPQGVGCHELQGSVRGGAQP